MPRSAKSKRLIDKVGSALEKVFTRRIVSGTMARIFPGYTSQQLHNPVFILGCGRSGTTMLNDLLAQHREIANWSEANNIWDSQWPYRMPPIWYDPIAHTTSWWHDTQKRQGQIRAIFGAYQWISRKPFFMNKSPLNTFRIPYLQQMFPGARFINMVRDGRAVILSYAKQRQEIRPSETQRMLGDNYTIEELYIQLAGFWKANVEEVARQDQSLRLSQQGLLLDLRYEEFCADPNANLTRVCDFLGLDPAGFNDTIRKEPVKDQNFKWRESLDPSLVEQLVNIMQPTFTARGFS